MSLLHRRPGTAYAAAIQRAGLFFCVIAGACAMGAAQEPQSAPARGAMASELQPAVFRAALAEVGPALVRIETIGGAMPVEQATTAEGEAVAASGFRQADGPTTGLVCGVDGYILTSSFNFVRDPTVITAALADGRRFVARLIARDRVARLALLKIEATGLPVPKWLPPDQLHVGQWALLSGYGHGGEAPALSAGVVSALSRLEGRAVQTDVRASPANYGGPLFDVEGRVIGICVPTAGRQEDAVAGVEWYDSGIGFAIRGDYVEQVLPSLRAGRDREQGRLGVTVDQADPVVGGKSDEASPGGVRVLELVPGGPAAAAGLLAGDLVISIDRCLTKRPLDVSRTLARMPAGAEVSITYMRGGAESTCSLVLASAEELERAARSATASGPTREAGEPAESP